MVVFVAGVLIAAMAALGSAGRLPRNHLVGIRIPSTMRTDAAWAAGHRAATVPVTLLGVSMLGVGLWDMSSLDGPPRGHGLLLLFVLGCGAWSVIAAHRAASRAG
jgi:hypothetical protein